MFIKILNTIGSGHNVTLLILRVL